MWREYRRGGKQVCNRRPAWHLLELDVEHGRVVRHHNGVVLGLGLALFSNIELGFETEIPLTYFI